MTDETRKLCAICGNEVRPMILRPDRMMCDICEQSHEVWVQEKIRLAVEESKWSR